MAPILSQRPLLNSNYEWCPWFPVSGLIWGSSGIGLGPVTFLFAMFLSTLSIENEGARIVKFADDLTLVERL